MAASVMNRQAQPISNLRLLRRRAGLSQLDLAALLGYRGHSQVSRYENGHRVPTPQEMLQLQVVFGVVTSRVFPQLHDRAVRTVSARIEKLLKRERNRRFTDNERPSRKVVHLQRVLDAIRRQLVPGLDIQNPWPTATTLEDPDPTEF